MSICKKAVLALSLVAFLFFIAHTVSAQNGAQGSGQDIVVDTSHAVNSFSPLRALGGAVDRQFGGTTEEQVDKHTDWVLTDPVLKELLDAGWGTVTYRQNTELQIEAWHWNPRGTWSNASRNKRAISSAARSQPAKRSSTPGRIRFPTAGNTRATDNGWSRLTDGDLNTYWKSNPYLTKAFTGEDDSLHPQWVMIDLGAKDEYQCHQDRLGESLRHAVLRAVLDGRKGTVLCRNQQRRLANFPHGHYYGRPGRNSHAEAGQLEDSRAIPAHLDDGILKYLRHAWVAGQAQLHGIRDQRSSISEPFRPTASSPIIVKHLPNRQQTITWPSSVDPWHAASDLEYAEETRSASISSSIPA